MHIVEPIAGDVADDSIPMAVSRWEITQTDASCEDRTLHVFFNYRGGILADLEVLHNLCIWQHLFQGGDGIQVVLCVHAIHLKLLWLCVDGCAWVCVGVCGCVGKWLCGYVSVWACGCVCVWACGCVCVWACGCVGVCVHVGRWGESKWTSMEKTPRLCYMTLVTPARDTVHQST